MGRQGVHSAHGELHIGLAGHDIHFRTDQRITQGGIREAEKKAESRPVSTPAELEGQFNRHTGTELHKGLYALSQVRLWNLGSLSIPSEVTDSLNAMTGGTLLTQKWDDNTAAIVHELLNKRRSDPEQIDFFNHLGILSNWVYTIRGFNRPNVTYGPGAEWELSDQTQNLNVLSEQFYILSMAILAHHPILQDPFNVVLPEVAFYPRTKYLNKLIEYLNTDARQTLLDARQINKKTLLHNIPILEALDFRRGKDSEITLFDILVEGANPVRVSFIGQDICDRLRVTSEALYQEFFYLTDDEFNTWAKELEKRKTLDTDQINAFAALYILTKAQSEVEFFAGSNASFDQVKTLEDLTEIIELSGQYNTEAQDLVETGEVSRHASPLSGRIDWLVMHVKHPKKRLTPNESDQDILNVLIEHAQQWYDHSPYPDLRNESIMDAIDHFAGDGKISIHMFDLKSSLSQRIPEETEAKYIRQLHFYYRMFMKTVIGFRNTTLPAQHQLFEGDSPIDNFGFRNRFTVNDLLSDPLFLAFKNASLMYFYAYRSEDLPTAIPQTEMRSIIRASQIDIGQELHDMDRNISLALQLKRKNRKLVERRKKK